MPRRDFAGPNDLIQVLYAPWTEAVQAPVVLGVPRLEPIAVRCGDGVTVARGDGEPVHGMLVRASKTQATTGEPWVLQYVAPS